MTEKRAGDLVKETQALTIAPARQLLGASAWKHACSASATVPSPAFLGKIAAMTATCLDLPRWPIKIIADNSTTGAAPVKAEPGDKVRVKVGDHTGQRGVVVRMEGDKLVLRIEESGSIVCVAPEQITNYSLAARKAWVTGPDRAVGRKKGTKLYDRISVTLRFDRDLWEHFLALEEEGFIEDRTALINGWFREKLALLDREGRQL